MKGVCNGIGLAPLTGWAWRQGILRAVEQPPATAHPGGTAKRQGIGDRSLQLSLGRILSLSEAAQVPVGAAQSLQPRCDGPGGEA